ncbi:ADP-ribose pyrophosphatase [Klebsiella oxytoca]|nr:ADP-ribose pyrophosphatase [Klebsiella oxytoca]CAH3544076.1 ADP-ribose pyrophosphatase [Klebsiella oxytoca]
MKKKLTSDDLHDAEVLAHCPWFSMRKVGIDMAPGDRRDFYSIHYPHPAVGIVAMQDDKVLLIRHYRYLIDRVVWAIPSGGVDEGEDPREAALRSCEKRPAGRRSTLKKLSAITPPTAAAISCLLPGWPAIWPGWEWMKTRTK